MFHVFWGLVYFQQKFIAHCSAIAQPLSRLTGGSKRKKLMWNPEMDKSFEQLKEYMAREILLSFLDYREGLCKLELYVDASGYRAGACLMQVQEGVHRAIAYNSMTFCCQAEVLYD